MSGVFAGGGEGKKGYLKGCVGVGTGSVKNYCQEQGELLHKLFFLIQPKLK